MNLWRTCAIALTGLALVSNAQADLTVLNKSTVVHVDESQPDTLYGFLAAVPATIFTQGGNVHQGLLITDNTTQKSNVYLLQDWAKFTAKDERRSLLLVGNVPAAVETSLTSGLAGAHVTKVSGDPIALSAAIAKATWKASPMAVVAPYVAGQSDADAQNAANAAVLASIKNVPLLFVPANGITAVTVQALKDLGVSRITVVDTTHKLADSALGGLADASITVEASLKATKDVVTVIRATAETSTIALMGTQWQGLGAAIAGARYHGTVHAVPAGITALARKALAHTPASLLSSTQKLAHPVRLGREETELSEIAAKFYKFLESVGADDANHLETVITFAEGNQSSGVPLTIERSLVGDPRRPSEKGAMPSRMPGNASENIAYINRTTLYRALIHSSARPKRVTMSFVAYEVEYPEGDLTFTDWENHAHKVNEFFGTHTAAYEDPGAYESFKAAGYDIGFHNGRNPDDAVSNPITNEKAFGFWKDLKDGASFFYESSHGGEDACYPLDTDNGIQGDDVAWGEAHWPSTSGRVNNSGPGYDANAADADFQGLNSTIAIFNACLMGGGPFPKVLMDHGSGAVVASYTSVSFDGGGKFSCDFTNQNCKDGVTVGQAYAYGMATTTESFPRGQTSGDSSLRFILFGDANMEFVKPSWKKPTLEAADAPRPGGTK